MLTGFSIPVCWFAYGKLAPGIGVLESLRSQFATLKKQIFEVSICYHKQWRGKILAQCLY